MTCQLLSGLFSYALQGLLGIISLSVLLLKYTREKKHCQGEARTCFTFCLDSSKQVLGAGWIHVMNLGLSMIISTVSEQANECEWYWINVMVDSTFGVGVNFFCLWLLHTLVSEVWMPCCQHADCKEYLVDLLNGVYTIQVESLRPSCSRNSLHEGCRSGTPACYESHRSLETDCTTLTRAAPDSRFDCKKYFLQVFLWLLIVTAMKLIVAGFTWAGAGWMLLLAAYILQPMRDNSNIELLFVMILTPTVMNIFQFWMTDDFIKFNPERQIDRRTGSYYSQHAHRQTGCAAWLPWFWWMLPILVAMIPNSFLGFVDMDKTCQDDHRNGPFVFYDVVYSLVTSSYFVVICTRICPFHPGRVSCWGLGMPAWLCGIFMVVLATMIFLLLILPVKEFAFGSWGSCVIAAPLWLGYSLGFFVTQPGVARDTETEIENTGSAHAGDTRAEIEDASVSCRPQQSRMDTIDRMKHHLEMINGIHGSDLRSDGGSIPSDFSGADPPMLLSLQQQVDRIEESQRTPFLIRRKQWLLWLFLGCFMLIDLFMYGVVFYLLRIFRDNSDGTTVIQKYFIFIGILIYCKILKASLKAVGFMCDIERASGSFDALFTGAIIGTLASNFFYRSVYLYVTNWQIFVMLHIFHIGGTWLEFVLPASKWYLRHIISNNWGNCIVKILQRTSFAKQRNVAAKDWQRLMAVFMSLHLYCVVFSIFLFSFASTAMKYGVNSGNWITIVTYRQLMLKLLVQLGTELLNAGLMELWYRKRLHIRGCKRMSSLLEDKQFRLFLIIAGTFWSLAVWVIALPNTFCAEDGVALYSQ